MRSAGALAALVLICALAADGIAGAPVDRCPDEGRPAAQKRCPDRAGDERLSRRSRPRLPPDESAIRLKGLEAGRPAPPAALPPARPAADPASPVPITGCDPNGCRDAAGTRYDGWGPGMIRSDGKLCQQVGNMMHCN